MTQAGTLTPRRLGAHTREAVALLFAGAVFAVLLYPVIDLLGWGAVVLPVGLLACWWLLWRPTLTLGIVFATTVLIEDSVAVFPFTLKAFWGDLPGGPIHVTDILVVVLVAGVVVQWAAGHELPGAGRFTLPLLMLALCTAGGLVTGYLGGGLPEDIYNTARVLALLVALPFLVAHVLADDDRRRGAVVFAGALVAGRAAIAVLGVVIGSDATTTSGKAGTEGFSATPSTFFEPTMNFLCVAFLLVVVAHLVVRRALPRWAQLGAVIAVVSLLFSFRRSVWIAAVLGIVLVVVVATGRRGRPWLVFAAIALGFAMWLSFSAGGSTDTTNPVLARAEQLSPSRLNSTSGDRYRIDEQKNVVAEIKAHPLTGLGLGVPWTARYPLAEEHVGGRYYTHVVPLWFWLKLGPLGFVTYVWLQGAAVVAGYRVWRRSRSPLERLTGLGLTFAFVGLVVAELTGPFTGVNLRITIVVACLIGWLAAAETASRRPAEVATGEGQLTPA